MIILDISCRKPGIAEESHLPLNIKVYIDMKKILFVVGSFRQQSFNKQLAAEAEKLIGNRGEVSYLDYVDLPFINQDIEYPAPVAVTRVREAVALADGMWIFSPEYNFSFPGHIKNLIDWLSRPLDPINKSLPLAINRKKIALSGAGGGAATARCRQKLSELLKLPYINADVMDSPQTGVALDQEAWTNGIFTLSDKNKADLAAQTEAFLDYLNLKGQ